MNRFLLYLLTFPILLCGLQSSAEEISSYTQFQSASAAWAIALGARPGREGRWDYNFENFSGGLPSYMAEKIRSQASALFASEGRTNCQVYSAGIASTYARKFTGRKTALSGKRFNPRIIQMAIPSDQTSYYGVAPGELRAFSVMSIAADGRLHCVPIVPVTDTGGFDNMGRTIDTSAALAAALHFKALAPVIVTSANCCPGRF